MYIHKIKIILKLVQYYYIFDSTEKFTKLRCFKARLKKIIYYWFGKVLKVTYYYFDDQIKEEFV